ncbi:factor of DNA methylation 1 [Brachypodium distachyon]|nr:factor of DNA methylation 1 [Brachypodium distachyon]|eukprot:XP_014753970.1 factor of DNA methylation 1 [Brachypodium distachyon]
MNRSFCDHVIFVWPWKGVLVNVPTEWKSGRHVGESGYLLREQLSEFCPKKVIPLWDRKRGHTGSAIVEFKSDWSGLKNALDFENHFEAQGCGEKLWKEKYKGSEIFGWVARANDFRSHGPIGAYVRKYGDLKTLADCKNDEERKSRKLEASFVIQVEVMGRHVQDVECKNNETAELLGRLEADMKKLHWSHDEEIRKIQQRARRDKQKIIDENQKLRLELEDKTRELDSKSRQLDEQAAQSDFDKRILQQEMEKHEVETNHVTMGILEHFKVHENLVELAEEHKREDKIALDKELELQKIMLDRQALEIEVKQLQGQLEVMKMMPGEEDSKKKILEDLRAKLEEKREEKVQEDMITRQTDLNNELQPARKKLINGFLEPTSG